MVYIRGNREEIDAWEGLGNFGWNWETLLPYYIKSENFTMPTDTQADAGATYDVQQHGFGGYLHTGYLSSLHNGSFAPAVMNTWEGLAQKHNPDLNSGNVRGFGLGPQTLDAHRGIRWDAARAYYHPIEGRTNLQVLNGAAKRITWADLNGTLPLPGTNVTFVASGVEYVEGKGNKTRIIKARREVIVSAGAVRTPLILESSGIGNSR